MEYFFVQDLMNNYEKLKTEVKKTGAWRDDMKFLYHLTRIFHHHTERNVMTFVKFPQIPSINNTRWNSRAILALLAVILKPKTRSRLLKICSFISNS